MAYAGKIAFSKKEPDAVLGKEDNKLSTFLRGLNLDKTGYVANGSVFEVAVMEASSEADASYETGDGFILADGDIWTVVAPNGEAAVALSSLDAENFRRLNSLQRAAVASSVSALTAAIDSEAKTARTEEKALSNAVKAENDRAVSAESDLQTDIATEKDRAEQAEQSLQTAVSDEATARAETDSSLSTAIDKKIWISNTDGVVSAESLSIQHIDRDGYHQKVLDGTVLSNVVYVVSADDLNMYNEKITNLLSGEAATDAATFGQVSAVEAKLTAADEAIKTSISGTSAAVLAEAARAEAAEEALSAAVRDALSAIELSSPLETIAAALVELKAKVTPAAE